MAADVGFFRALLRDSGAAAAALLAIPASLAPRRHWDALEPLPVSRMTLLSGLITVMAGGAIGVGGFLAFAQRASDAIAQATLDQAARLAQDPTGPDTISLMGPMVASGLSPAAFLVASPVGWLADYLAISGVVRAIAAWFDEPFGDPLLTGLDGLLFRGHARAAASRDQRRRERLEGPETPDRLFPASWADLSDADLVVVASRRKPDWTRGTFVITSDKWYTLGEPFDLQTPEGLRSVYPLTEQKVSEVLRRGVSYELPPLEPVRRPGPPAHPRPTSTAR